MSFSTQSASPASTAASVSSSVASNTSSTTSGSHSPIVTAISATTTSTSGTSSVPSTSASVTTCPSQVILIQHSFTICLLRLMRDSHLAPSLAHVLPVPLGEAGGSSTVSGCSHFLLLHVKPVVSKQEDGFCGESLLHTLHVREDNEAKVWNLERKSLIKSSQVKRQKNLQNFVCHLGLLCWSPV